jgi:hypothetical protein
MSATTRSEFRSTLPILLAAFLLAPGVRAAVLIVDPAGGPLVHPDPQSAIDAASEGDTILIRAGDYAATFSFPPRGIDIRSKSLTLVADPMGAAVKVPFVAVRGLAAGQRVVLRGLDVSPTYHFLGGSSLPLPAMTVELSAGGVFVEDSRFLGGTGSALFHQPFPGEPALDVDGAHVVAVRCEFLGGSGFPGDMFTPPGAGGPAIVAAGSTLALYESVVAGRAASTAGDGLLVAASVASLAGVTVEGGDAGTGFGGDGLVADAASQVRSLDSTFTGGTGVAVPGGPGDPVVAPPGVLVTWPVQSRALTLSSPVQEFAPVAITFEGQAGDLVLALWSPAPGFLHIGGTAGDLLLAPPLFGPFVLLTLTAPSGTETYTVNAPALVPASVDAFTFLVQPYFTRPGETVAGAPSAFVLVR